MCDGARGRQSRACVQQLQRFSRDENRFRVTEVWMQRGHDGWKGGCVTGRIDGFTVYQELHSWLKEIMKHVHESRFLPCLQAEYHR